MYIKSRTNAITPNRREEIKNLNLITTKNKQQNKSIFKKQTEIIKKELKCVKRNKAKYAKKQEKIERKEILKAIKKANAIWDRIPIDKKKN